MSEEWRSWPMRQRIIQQIDEHLRQTPEGAKRTAHDLENSLYTRATKKEEYLQFVSKIIMYLKEQAQNTNQNSSNLTAMLSSGQQGNTSGQVSVGQGVTSCGQITLVNSGTNQMVHTNQNQMSHGNQLTHGNAPGQIMGMQGAQGVGPGMAPGQMVGGPNRMNQSMISNMPNQGEMNNWTTQGKQRHNPNDMIRMGMNVKHTGMNPMGPMNAQAGKMGQMQMQMQGQNDQVNQMSIGGQMPRQTLTMQPRVPSPGFAIGTGPHPRQGTSTPTSVSPASQQHGGPHSLTFISPSPSSNTAHSPAGPRALNQLGVPSPGSGMINTPGQPQQPSPANASSMEDRAYMDKVRQLQHKYLGTLREVAEKFGNADTESARKVRNLLEVIENPQRRTANGMETLRRCEKVLEKLGIQKRETRDDGSGKNLPRDNPTAVLFEAINLALKSPLGFHTIHRTLSPALKTLLGPELEPPMPKKMKTMEKTEISAESSLISEIIQGEVARLPPRFKVNLDGHHQNGGDDLTLICQLDDPNLPCIPPITLIIPPLYPNAPPRCKLSKVDYNTTPFLNKVSDIMMNRQLHLPEVCTLTMILDTWEMSVRRACSTKPFSTDSIDPLKLNIF